VLSLGEVMARSRFGDHLDRVARALLEAHATAGTTVVEIAVALAWPKLFDGLLWTCCVALIALEAVAAREAALRLVNRLPLAEPSEDLVKTAGALRGRQHLLRRRLGIGVNREVQHG